MSKKQHRDQLAAALAAHLGAGGTIEVLPPGRNTELDAYLLSAARRTAANRGSSSVRHSRSRWFARGEGTV